MGPESVHKFRLFVLHQLKFKASNIDYFHHTTLCPILSDGDSENTNPHHTRKLPISLVSFFYYSLVAQTVAAMLYCVMCCILWQFYYCINNLYLVFVRFYTTDCLT